MQASDIKTPIKEMALYKGLRCTTIETAQPIASPPKSMKKIVLIKSDVRCQMSDVSQSRYRHLTSDI
jgi:hypothetical protein